MQLKFDAFIRNHTWDLVPATSNQIIVDCKWIYRIKKKADGSVDRYKARLVAKGFTQRSGIDYHSTFSPVVKPTTVHVVLFLAVQNNWLLNQLNVNNAFLQGTFKEKLFMRQPPGFEDLSYPSHVCRLGKAIYGLKQAPHAWYNELSTHLLSLSFVKSKLDPSLFIYSTSKAIAYLLVNVDDIILTGNDATLVKHIISFLSGRFSLKDLGPLTYFLGIEVHCDSTGMVLPQSKYISKLLHDLNMHECKGIQTPMSSSQSLKQNDGTPSHDATEYR